MVKAKKHVKSTSKDKWFIKVRGSYLPNNRAGWLTYIPYTAFLLTTLQYVHYKDLGWADAMFVLFPNWVAAFMIMTWIASKKS